jgi:Transposase DDE domain group 1
VSHTAAYWLMLAVRDSIPQTAPLAKAEFATIRERLSKVGARIIEHAARIRIHLPAIARRGRCSASVALGIMPAAP